MGGGGMLERGAGISAAAEASAGSSSTGGSDWMMRSWPFSAKVEGFEPAPGIRSVSVTEMVFLAGSRVTCSAW